MVIVFLTLTILLITVGTAFGRYIKLPKLCLAHKFFAVICVAKQLQGVKAKVVLFMVCPLGMLSLIFLIVFSIITGVQQGKFLLHAWVEFIF